MEAAVAGGGGGGGGPAPFLIKTYEMVDDSSTDEIVSWSSSNASFVVWNPPEFAANLLPTYFKHNNFSSFIRQLNTYGFRKIDPERWEFANEEFIKDQKHLLKNIHRRKPIHSHSHPPPGSSLPDPERMALEEEIERLSREKVALTADLWRFKQHQSGTRIQLEDLDRRLHDMEQRQANMLAFLDRALRNPKFVDNLIKMASASGPDLLFSSSLLHKKRRLPGGLDSSLDTFYQDNSNKPDAGQAFSQDFCDKLKLGLCSAAVISESSDSNLDLAVVTASATPRSSDEPEGSPRVVEHSRNGNGRLECLAFVPGTLEHEHSDAGASLCPRRNPLFPPGSPDDGEDGLIPCHLNLTLASSSMQLDKSASLTTSQNSIPEEAMMANEGGGTDREANQDRQSNTNHAADGNATPPQEEAARTTSRATPAAPGRVNDVFWEQFLTERPGSSDTEEASSNLRMDPCVDPQEGRRPGYDGMRKSRKDMERLSL